ncbi:class I SAM-dependent methyltransferase [Bacteroidota bacterium]
MNYYNSIADGYDELHRDEQLKKLKIIKENLDINKDDLMLDVGCGTGFSAEVFDCKIVGLDPSEKLLEKCFFRTINASAEEIPFLDGYFDIVISVTAIQNFEDYKKGLLEIKRVGRDRFALSVLKKANNIRAIQSFIEKNFSVKKIINEEKDLIFII